MEFYFQAVFVQALITRTSERYFQGISNMLSFINDISLYLILHEFGILCDLAEACGVYPPVCLPGLFNARFSFDFCCDAGVWRDGFML